MPSIGTTTARGYGYAHKQARRAALRRMRDGDPCARCGGPMSKADPRQLHFDHTDDRTSYLGLSHAYCNMADGARKAGRIAAARRRGHQLTATRSWNSRNW